MTTQDIVAVERPSRARAYALLVSLLDRLPAPKEISFSLDYPGSVWIQLESVEDFDEWTELMSARVDSRDHLIHSGDSVQSHAAATWHGWRVYLQVCILVSNAERLTADEAASVLEEPERTLTAVEDDAARCTRCHERPSASLTGLCDPCTVSGGRASGSGWGDAQHYDASAEDRHETTVVGTDTTGWTWQCTCGYSAPTTGVYHVRDSAEYDARQHEQQFAPAVEPVTDAAEISADAGAKAEEAGDL